MSNSKQNKKKVMLMILDGWGLNKSYHGNAISLAKKPFYDKLWKDHPSAVIEASGESIGLPEGQMGTSEVNHMIIGAGKIFFQDLVRINRSIDSGEFGAIKAFQDAFAHVKKHKSHLHLMGLVSDGGVHSHINHFKALLAAAKKAGISQVYVHAFTDGRDTSPTSGVKYIQELEDEMRQLGVGKIASVVGRYYAMDRDKNWDRVNMAFQMLTEGKGESFSSAIKAIQASYQKNITDEFIQPAVVEATSGDRHTIEENDALVYVNFRSDRARQLSEVFLKHGFDNLFFATMAQYNPNYAVEVAFPPEEIEVTLGQVLSDAGLKQLRIAETEKFAHLTFFLNCKRELAYEGEDRMMFDSYSDIPTHDHRPEMRTPDLAEELVKTLEMEKYEMIFTNWCNADMIGHTGNIPAAIKGIETIDAGLAKVIPVAIKHGYDVLITADHGNADEMLDEETGEMITSHSVHPVPLILVSADGDNCKVFQRKSGLLRDIAPTILTLLGQEIPRGMNGESFV
ncbi:MAG: 2,3-bisphosphoglycerate-independent phosphoglycerate mutase [Patescibacteria group bacterium]